MPSGSDAFLSESRLVPHSYFLSVQLHLVTYCYTLAPIPMITPALHPTLTAPLALSRLLLLLVVAFMALGSLALFCLVLPLS